MVNFNKWVKYYWALTKELSAEWWDKLLKFLFTWLPLFAFIIFVTIICIYVTKLCVRGEVNAWEQRLYIWSFLFFVLMTTFGILRIYNAVLGNSAMLTHLIKSLNKLLGSFVNLEKEIGTNTKELRKVDSSVGELSEDMKRVLRDRKERREQQKKQNEFTDNPKGTGTRTTK